MHAITDILHYAKELKEAGVPDKQAEIHAERFATIIENNLATKDDLKILEVKIDAIATNLKWLVTLLSIIGTLLTIFIAIPNLLNLFHILH